MPVPTRAIVAASAVALVLAWVLRQQQASAEPAPGVQVILPPIPLTGGGGDTQSILNGLTPTIRPHLVPPGWTVSWPTVEIPTAYGTAQVQPPTTELPLLPRAEVERLASILRPQLVQTANGLAIQVTTTIPT